jgi:iron complex outermembrane receptor protein
VILLGDMSSFSEKGKLYRSGHDVLNRTCSPPRSIVSLIWVTIDQYIGLSRHALSVEGWGDAMNKNLNAGRISILRAALPLLSIVFTQQASAQASGAPASGTTIMPPLVAPDRPLSSDNTAGVSSDGLQDIIVTARRTRERLQSTPVAVTALNNEALLTKQVASVTDLARTAPAVSIRTGGSAPSTTAAVAIRGQAQNSPNSFSDASVGIYIDGVYVGRPIIGNLGFLDMASAEVLRGPQGTLFGRNTVGGALNLTTAAPQYILTGYIKAGIGNYQQRIVEGVLNVPLSTELAVRFAGRYDEHGPYYSNPFGKDQAAITGSYFGRMTLKYSPASLPVVWTIGGDYLHYRDTGNATALAAIAPNSLVNNFYNISQGVRSGTIAPTTPITIAAGVTAPASTFTGFTLAGSGPLSQYINPVFDGSSSTGGWLDTYRLAATGEPGVDDPFNRNDAWSVTSNLSIDLNGVALKSITGYRDSKTLSNGNMIGAPVAAIGFASDYTQSQFSQELQLTGTLGRIDYILGAYYFRETGYERIDSATFYNTPLANFRRDLSSFKARSVGAFAQANYRLTDRLRATAGFRYTWDTRFINRRGTTNWRLPAEQQVCAVGPNSGRTAAQALCNDPNSAKFSYPAWTAGLDFAINPQLFVYVKSSGASMSGGFVSRPVPPPNAQFFRPENLRDVEFGFKGDLLDRRLRTNFAAFYAWQAHAQRTINATFTDAANRLQTTQFIANSGDVRLYGGEFEGTVIPWNGMTIDTSAAYLHARYVSGSRIETQLIAGIPVQIDRSNEPIAQAPKWTFGLGATQVVDFDVGKLTLHADYAYVSSRFFEFSTSADPSPVVQNSLAILNAKSKVKGYGLVSGQIGVALNQPKVEIIFWGKNLFNKPNFTAVWTNAAFGSASQFQGVPRTYGMTVSASF